MHLKKGDWKTKAESAHKQQRMTPLSDASISEWCLCSQEITPKNANMKTRRIVYSITTTGGNGKHIYFSSLVIPFGIECTQPLL